MIGEITRSAPTAEPVQDGPGTDVLAHASEAQATAMPDLDFTALTHASTLACADYLFGAFAESADGAVTLVGNPQTVLADGPEPPESPATRCTSDAAGWTVPAAAAIDASALLRSMLTDIDCPERRDRVVRLDGLTCRALRRIVAFMAFKHATRLMQLPPVFPVVPEGTTDALLRAELVLEALLSAKFMQM